MTRDHAGPMPDRNAKIHGDEGTYDPEPYRARALDDVIETILAFGQYPQPRTGRYSPGVRRIEFDLREWCVENLEPDELAGFLVAHITVYDDTYGLQMKLERDIEARLREELADSGMVNEKIDEIYHDEME